MVCNFKENFVQKLQIKIGKHFGDQENVYSTKDYPIGPLIEMKETVDIPICIDYDIKTLLSSKLTLLNFQFF
jgi:hypothetical protein